jgi:hypothetical protein
MGLGDYLLHLPPLSTTFSHRSHDKPMESRLQGGKIGKSLTPEDIVDTGDNIE